MDPFFNPKSVAIVGASNDKNKVGYSLVANVKAGSPRTIYPVSLAEKEVLGIPAVRSILDIAGTVDLALIAVRADFVPGIIEDCAKKGIRHVAVISAGFKEAGENGKRLEADIARIAKERGIALLGPNCLGTIDANADFNGSFIGVKPLPGRIAFLSQSGALGTAMLDWAIRERIGFSKFISLGNEASLTELDFLDILAQDADTDAILVYLEQVADGRAFMEKCARITKEKPIVVIKAGVSARGASAVASHTGSLAPASTVFAAACRQSGVVLVDTIRDFFSAAKLLALGLAPARAIRRLAIVTNGGGPSVVATDRIEMSANLSLASFDEPTKASLRSVLPPMAAVGNPVDVIGDALADRYKAALTIVSALPDVDGIIAIVTPQMMTEAAATARVFAECRKQKPLFPVLIGGESLAPGVAELAKSGMVNFDTPDDAIAALNAFASVLDSPIPANGARAHAKGTAGARLLSYTETVTLIERYGLSWVGRFCTSPDELPSAFSTLRGEKAVLKALGPDIIHKTDLGAVRLRVRGAEAARDAWADMEAEIHRKLPSAHIDGVLVQPTVSGKELIIGMKRDATFGATILVGMGGVFAEALKDTAVRVAPVSEKEALKMLCELKGAPVLKGLRGEAPIDFVAVERIIAAISKLALEHPDILEIDLNPVFAGPDGAKVVDVRIMVKS